jgi:hypothetical protein
MTQYQGNVQSYVLEIESPNNPYTHNSVITLHGAFGLAILYFVPQDGQLDSWPHFTDLLRNEKPVHFQYDDSNNTAQISSVRATVPGGSSRYAERFIKAHLLSRQNPKENYIISDALPCAVRFE